MRGFSKKPFKKLGKFGNIKTVYNGMKFDSLGECDCYKFYELLQRAGVISGLSIQPKVYMTDAKILYKPDLTYLDIAKNEWEYVDYKGRRTAVFQVKKRLWKHYGPGRLILCSGYGLDIKIIETIIPKGEEEHGNRSRQQITKSRRRSKE